MNIYKKLQRVLRFGKPGLRGSVVYMIEQAHLSTANAKSRPVATGVLVVMMLGALLYLTNMTTFDVRSFTTWEAIQYGKLVCPDGKEKRHGNLDKNGRKTPPHCYTVSGGAGASQ